MKNRINDIQFKLADNEAFIVSSAANRLYYTGFSSSAGVIVISKVRMDFLIDFRYYEKAKKNIHHCNIILLKKLSQQLPELLKDHGVDTVYLETSYASINDLLFYQKILPEYNVSINDCFDRIALESRSIKSNEELQNIIKAQEITDDTFEYILNKIKPGITEKQLMLEMEFFLRKQGSEGVSFDFIVVSGKNSSLPHGIPTDKIIQPGDFITMDFGAVFNGYRSDMTRTIAVGLVNDEQRRVYNTVLEAQKRSLEAIKPGVSCKEIDRIARDFIAENGYEGCFGHGLGHSVGIEIHESPALNTTDTTILRPGMVLTVEPGIYLEDQFGVRIEDMVYVTEEGYVNITKSPKDLIVL